MNVFCGQLMPKFTQSRPFQSSFLQTKVKMLQIHIFLNKVSYLIFLKTHESNKFKQDVQMGLKDTF